MIRGQRSVWQSKADDQGSENTPKTIAAWTAIPKGFNFAHESEVAEEVL